MPAAPLPQPAPFTCPNCGTELETKPQFCPHCGAQLDEREGSQNTRAPSAIASAFLIWGLVVFASIGACGAYFTVSALQQSGTYLKSETLTVSEFSLALGAVGLGLCLLAFFRRKR